MAKDKATSPKLQLTVLEYNRIYEVIYSVFDRSATVDFLNAVDRWFKKYPKKLDDLSLLNDLGEVHKLTLSAPRISGAW